MATSFLPDDHERATLLGRVQTAAGPTPVMVHQGVARDLSAAAPTISQVLNRFGTEAITRLGVEIDPAAIQAARPVWDGVARPERLLAPIDLQCIKACGVTFAVSALERVIEERARGDRDAAVAVRAALKDRAGAGIEAIRPGSPEAVRLKAALIADGLWSQYLEVAIGPDAEVFTKAPVLAAVGWGEDVGVRDDSQWNNPEPEVVLICDGQGIPRGAALGNDVNLRDFEGRSALLLGKAKDNNASCAIGPFIRLFDADFTLDDVRSAEVSLEVRGEDGFELSGVSSMRQISRDPLDLVTQTLSRHHQYPDGFALFLGTMFAPTMARGEAGDAFTHRPGDRVRVSSPRLGALENRVATCDAAAPWTFGIGQLMENLSTRGLLGAGR